MLTVVAFAVVMCCTSSRVVVMLLVVVMVVMVGVMVTVEICYAYASHLCLVEEIVIGCCAFGYEAGMKYRLNTSKIK